MSAKPEEFDREKVHTNLARLKKGGHNFEVVIDPDKAAELKEGADVEIADILKSEHVFFDAKKGVLAPEHLLEAVFGSSDPINVAGVIISAGEVQLTAAYRERKREEKRRMVIQLIHHAGVDPRTGLPHPPERISRAMDEARVRIDDSKGAEDQIKDIVKKLRSVLPVKFEVRRIMVRVPPEFSAKSVSVIKGFATLISEEWLNDGSLRLVVELPAGIQQDFFDALNRLTKGSAETSIVNRK
ncbi:ribosome assembly factor SBDS [Candidatus Woesearchaeota archaeon CG08_land_8_20_14_0_20_47_9]|nr:MAG: ribosome assembly factor SBDS [Candidatus Woesearchaeota archaeon CG08_land_8_20_14_0_20_47_9]HII30106.1 ribosome assembly factor SBDS [Candidatus Woesearchaeota archaeon]